MKTKKLIRVTSKHSISYILSLKTKRELGSNNLELCGMSLVFVVDTRAQPILKKLSLYYRIKGRDQPPLRPSHSLPQTWSLWIPLGAHIFHKACHRLLIPHCSDDSSLVFILCLVTHPTNEGRLFKRCRHSLGIGVTIAKKTDKGPALTELIF